MKIILVAAIVILASSAQAQTYFAEIDLNGTVLRVIVADQAFINSGKVGSPLRWKQTFIDGKQHKRYAGKGYQFDTELKAFLTPQPFPSWKLNKETAEWEPPTPRPKNGEFQWNEQKQIWITTKGKP